MLTGNVTGECRNRHTAKEYREFLKRVDKTCEKDKAWHIIADKYSTHNTNKGSERIVRVSGRQICDAFYTYPFIPA
jgi:hypothetical protein